MWVRRVRGRPAPAGPAESEAAVAAAEPAAAPDTAKGPVLNGGSSAMSSASGGLGEGPSPDRDDDDDPPTEEFARISNE